MNGCLTLWNDSYICLPQRSLRQSVAPFEKHRPRPWIVQRLDRKITECALNALDLLDIVSACTWRNSELKFRALRAASSLLANCESKLEQKNDAT